MANYKLITHVSVGSTSEPMFTAGATNTVVSSITAKDGSGQTAEVLIQKNGVGTVIEMAEVSLTSNAGFQIIDVAFALEAGDKVYIRSSRGGMQFIMSYVEETELSNDTNLGGLADVDTTGATDGQSLVYSSSANVWQPSTVTGGGGGGSSDLDGLSDVVITSAGAGDVLRHNGSEFVNTNLNTQIDGRLATLDADDIDDTSTVHRFVTSQMQTNLGFLAPVTGNIDLDQHDADITANNAKAGYTTALFDADLANSDTDDVDEGTSNLYYTEARVSANADVAANTAKVSYTDSAAVSANTTKLAGIDAGATANDTDANLKNRANHTGTQLSSTISDFQAEVEDIIADQIGNTDDVSEGTTNLYHTDARVDARIGAADIADLNNVSSTAPSSGEVLKWNGTAWAPATDNSGTGGGTGVPYTGATSDVDLNGQDLENVGTVTADAALFGSSPSNLRAFNIKGTGLDGRLSIQGGSGDSPGIELTTDSNASRVLLRLKEVGTDGTSLEVFTEPNGGSIKQSHTFGSDGVLYWHDTSSLDAGIRNNSGTMQFLNSGGSWANISSSTGGSGGVVNSVNGISQATVVLDADDIDDASTAHKFVTATDVTKLGNITAPSAVNLDTINLLASTAFSTANQAASDISSHEGSLRNHSDITYSQANPANMTTGAFLVWDGTSSWNDEVVGLQDLHNVDTPTTGEYLKWNGTTWETDAVTGGTTYTAGDGLNLVGTEFSVEPVQDADTALTSAGNYEAGAKLLGLANTNTALASGKIYGLKSSGWDATTNATEAGSSGLIAMCSSDSTTGSAMILEGVCRTRLNISAASIGDPVYLGTASEVTLSAPTSAATVLQLGTVVDPTNNMIYFSPDKTTITIQ